MKDKVQSTGEGGTEVNKGQEQWNIATEKGKLGQLTGVRRRRKEDRRQGTDHVRQGTEDGRQGTKMRDRGLETWSRDFRQGKEDGRQGTETQDRGREQGTESKEKDLT